MTLTAPGTMDRHIIDWHQPALPATAEWLVSKWAGGDTLDMSGLVLVLPTSRSGRRLLELLMDRSETDGRVFTPPEITTIGNVPELLYRPSRPLASGLVQSLAWVRALQESPEAELREFTRMIPQRDDSLGWRSLASLLGHWHQELAGNGLTFSDVLVAGDQLENFSEHRRWQALGAVQRRYLDGLHAQGLWDRQTARLVALEKHECAIDRQLVLIGMVDMNPVFRDMLHQVADQVTVVVLADASQADWFDDLGCLNIDRWQEAALDIEDDAIWLADQPADQARLVVQALQQLDGQYPIDEVTVTVPDPRLVSHISRALAAEDVPVFDSGGSSIGNTRPFVLLELLSRWLQDETFEAFASLVRHPDIYSWLVHRTGNDDWLAELDRYQNNRLPFYVYGDISQMYFGGKDYQGRPQYANLEQAYAEIHELIQPVRRLPGGDGPVGKPLDAWARPWRQIMVAIYRDTILDQTRPDDRRTIRACQAIVSSLIEIEQAAAMAIPDVDSVDALQWALALCHHEFLADPVIPGSLSLLGWLETPWDDAAVTIVTGVNDGWIPSTENSSLFLPNSIRRRLGLLDNQRRYARDAYATLLILKSRQRVRFIAGRRDDDGQPLLPSRLLMTGRADDIARRARRLFDDGDSILPQDHRTSVRPASQQLVIPLPPADAPPVNSMRVTDFRMYLMCPYRFYLTRVLGLERLSDSLDELDGARFGSLLHDVVENFGRSESRDSDDPETIEAVVLNCLERFALARYGRRPMPAVAIQLEQARLRLRAFAKWQATHRRAGYQIVDVEREKTRHEFELDGEPFEIRGQIDRIDINHQKRTIGVFDYKTGDVRKGPDEYHRNGRGEWVDLQLPLYEYLLKEFDLPADYDTEFGLILLARETDQIFLELADWSGEQLADANRLAREVMRDVRAGKFWPPRDENVPTYLDDLAGLCQSRVFQRWTPDGPPGETALPVLRPHFTPDESFTGGSRTRTGRQSPGGEQ